MPSLFTDMAGKVIDELEPHERTLVDPKVFARILQICAGYAEERFLPPRTAPVLIPSTHLIRARYVRENDIVWLGGRFDRVAQVMVDDLVRMVLSDETVLLFDPADMVEISQSKAAAREWNRLHGAAVL